ncbi:MAG: hypothetical protein JWP35_3477 [Caulobacter sp.]|nr:hypothetical protein [Caulobacter sp.]
MSKVLTALYSVLCYVFAMAAIVYLMGFVEGLLVLKSIDSGDVGALWPSLLIDLALLAIFGLQHSVMARPGFKRVWTRFVPEAAERSTYLVFAGLALVLLFWQWRPLTQSVWRVDNTLFATLLIALSWVGWGMVLLSTYLISHPHLFGLTQGFAALLGRREPEARFVTPLLYKWSRHPLYTGFIIAFWAAPAMTLGHLVFAIGTTLYILIAIWFEERDLVAAFGDRYRQYRQEVGMIFPRLGQRRARETPPV